MTAGAAALMRTAAAPDLDTTGIPVVLALTEVAGPVRRTASDAARADGERLAELARRLHTTLWPRARDGDLFTTYAVLATVGRADLDGAVPAGDGVVPEEPA